MLLPVLKDLELPRMSLDVLAAGLWNLHLFFHKRFNW